MIGMKYWLKINGVPNDFRNLVFGRQLPYLRLIQQFQDTAQSTHVRIKRTTAAKALRDFKDLYHPTEYYAKFQDGREARDDVFQVWYKTA